MTDSAPPASPRPAERPTSRRGNHTQHDWARSWSLAGIVAALCSVPLAAVIQSLVADFPSPWSFLAIALACVPGFALSILLANRREGRVCSRGLCVLTWAMMLSHWAGLAATGGLIGALWLGHLGLVMAAPGAALIEFGPSLWRRSLGGVTLGAAILAVALLARSPWAFGTTQAQQLLSGNVALVSGALALAALAVLRRDLDQGVRALSFGITLCALPLGGVLVNATQLLSYPSMTFPLWEPCLGIPTVLLAAAAIALGLLPPTGYLRNRAPGAPPDQPVQITCPHCARPMAYHPSTQTACGHCAGTVRLTSDELFCSRCEYPVWDQPTRKCPECGQIF